MLGDELRRAREAATLTQESVAQKARISREYLSKVECGHASPSVDVFLRVCRAIGVSAAAVIDHVESRPRH